MHIPHELFIPCVCFSTDAVGHLNAPAKFNLNVNLPTTRTATSLSFSLCRRTRVCVCVCVSACVCTSLSECVCVCRYVCLCDLFFSFTKAYTFVSSSSPNVNRDSRKSNRRTGKLDLKRTTSLDNCTVLRYPHQPRWLH